MSGLERCLRLKCRVCPTVLSEIEEDSQQINGIGNLRISTVFPSAIQ